MIRQVDKTRRTRYDNTVMTTYRQHSYDNIQAGGRTGHVNLYEEKNRRFVRFGAIKIGEGRVY